MAGTSCCGSAGTGHLCRSLRKATVMPTLTPTLMALLSAAPVSWGELADVAWVVTSVNNWAEQPKQSFDEQPISPYVTTGSVVSEEGAMQSAKDIAFEQENAWCAGDIKVASIDWLEDHIEATMLPNPANNRDRSAFHA